MTYTEFLKWHEYFQLQPYGWRDDNRAVNIMQTFGGKIDGSKVFESLAIMKHSTEERKQREREEAKDGTTVLSTSNLQNSAFFAQMLKATGGDVIDV
jgi:hypothetical protein